MNFYTLLNCPFFFDYKRILSVFFFFFWYSYFSFLLVTVSLIYILFILLYSVYFDLWVSNFCFLYIAYGWVFSPVWWYDFRLFNPLKINVIDIFEFTLASLFSVSCVSFLITAFFHIKIMFSIGTLICLFFHFNFYFLSDCSMAYSIYLNIIQIYANENLGSYRNVTLK